MSNVYKTSNYNVSDSENDYEYVGFWIRFLASTIDYLCVFIIVFALGAILILSGVESKTVDGQNPLPGLVLIAVPIVLIIWFWSRFAATPGKMIFKAKILDAKTLEYASTGKLVLRFFGYIISFIPLFLGFFWAAFDSKKQTLHDKIAGTVVVNEKHSDKAFKRTPSAQSSMTSKLKVRNTTYKVIIKSKVKEGMRPDDVRNQISTLFNVPVKKLKLLFSGKDITVKRTSSEESALQYQSAISKTGAQCFIAPEKEDLNAHDKSIQIGNSSTYNSPAHSQVEGSSSSNGIKHETDKVNNYKPHNQKRNKAGDGREVSLGFRLGVALLSIPVSFLCGLFMEYMGQGIMNFFSGANNPVTLLFTAVGGFLWLTGLAFKYGGPILAAPWALFDPVGFLDALKNPAVSSSKETH